MKIGDCSGWMYFIGFMFRIVLIEGKRIHVYPKPLGPPLMGKLLHAGVCAISKSQLGEDWQDRLTRGLRVLY